MEDKKIIPYKEYCQEIILVPKPNTAELISTGENILIDQRETASSLGDSTDIRCRIM